MKVPPQTSRQNFLESPINTGPRAAVTPSETAKQSWAGGQLNAKEREILIQAIVGAPVAPRTVLEVGTWLGGGSTLHILRALEKNGKGHLWGIEADHSIYERMLANLKAEAPEMINRFTPLFGFSQEVIPRWIDGQSALQVDFVFLDGGNRPLEQMTEFQLLA